MSEPYSAVVGADAEAPLPLLLAQCAQICDVISTAVRAPRIDEGHIKRAQQLSLEIAVSVDEWELAPKDIEASRFRDLAEMLDRGATLPERVVRTTFETLERLSRRTLRDFQLSESGLSPKP